MPVTSERQVAPVEPPGEAAVVVRSGLIVRVDGFRDQAEALEAAGLRE